MRQRNFAATSSCATRREWLRSLYHCLGGAVTLGSSSWLGQLAQAAPSQATTRTAPRVTNCILLWMPGGPSQIDTFDPKPNHENGGPVKAIATSVPGVSISEYLPKLSRWMHHLCPIRSMTSKEGDHSRAMYAVRTGYLPQGPIDYPVVGSLVAKEFETRETSLPKYVSIAPNTVLSPGSFGPGFLGPAYGALSVGANQGYDLTGDSLKVDNLERPGKVGDDQLAQRRRLWQRMQARFETRHPDVSVQSHRTAYQQAIEMMDSQASRIFDLSSEPEVVRSRFGNHPFGQGCLLARRLVEQGVPFVEVGLNGVPGSNVFGWDTHVGNFDATRSLCQVLDEGWSALMSELEERGLLESTLIVWMGEFGRTPRINGNSGRDHFPNAWTAVLGGGGIRGGTCYGKTSEDGQDILENRVTVPELLATVCTALGIDPTKQNMSRIGRPIPIVDHFTTPIAGVLR